MRKFLSPLKKNNKIFFRFALFIIMILPLSQLIEAQENKNTPEFYEFYISQNGKKIEIPEMPTMLQSPIKAISEPWNIPGINSRPKLTINEQRPVIYINKNGINLEKIKLVRLLYFEKLRVFDFQWGSLGSELHKKPNGEERNSLRNFGQWAAVGTYPIKGGPMPNNPDLYCIRPKERLAPGVYTIYQCPGIKDSSCFIPFDLGIPLRTFEITGEEAPFFELIPSNNPSIKIIKSNISNVLKGIKCPRAGKYNYLFSEEQIFAYIEVEGQRGGEIVEFLWHRPDGSIHARQKRILDFPKPGRIISILQEFVPSNLLMPGKWVLGIKIYGELVKCIPFYVGTE
ncbi:MAG: hypothetical protein ISS41_05295 [Candidatus Aminicenantes bacterium]|nr:hypothetical protein [Candidatus Aminicenantes bacterium]